MPVIKSLTMDFVEEILGESYQLGGDLNRRVDLLQMEKGPGKGDLYGHGGG